MLEAANVVFPARTSENGVVIVTIFLPVTLRVHPTLSVNPTSTVWYGYFANTNGRVGIGNAWYATSQHTNAIKLWFQTSGMSLINYTVCAVSLDSASTLTISAEL